MQADGLWLSIATGVGLGVVYVAASYLSNIRALRSKQRPMQIVAVMMLLRIFVALLVLVGIVMLLPVTPSALMGSFFVMFIAGLGVEVWLLHRKGASESGVGTPS